MKWKSVEKSERKSFKLHGKDFSFFMWQEVICQLTYFLARLLQRSNFKFNRISHFFSIMAIWEGGSRKWDILIKGEISLISYKNLNLSRNLKHHFKAYFFIVKFIFIITFKYKLPCKSHENNFLLSQENFLINCWNLLELKEQNRQHLSTVV